MLSYDWKISENYHFEFSMLHRLIYDNSWHCSFEIEVVTKHDYDHCPKFDMIVIFLKWKVFEIGIYNVNHVEKE